jgi:hypothetical protein
MVSVELRDEISGNCMLRVLAKPITECISKLSLSGPILPPLALMKPIIHMFLPSQNAFERSVSMIICFKKNCCLEWLKRLLLSQCDSQPIKNHNNKIKKEASLKDTETLDKINHSV